jgi:hypothetical protein
MLPDSASALEFVFHHVCVDPDLEKCNIFPSEEDCITMIAPAILSTLASKRELQLILQFYKWCKLLDLQQGKALSGKQNVFLSL